MAIDYAPRPYQSLIIDYIQDVKRLVGGFNIVDVYLCEVMMYDGEHVWLKLLSDLGHDIGKYTTTRIDKVDVKVWKGNKDA